MQTVLLCKFLTSLHTACDIEHAIWDKAFSLRCPARCMHSNFREVSRIQKSRPLQRLASETSSSGPARNFAALIFVETSISTTEKKGKKWNMFEQQEEIRRTR